MSSPQEPVLYLDHAATSPCREASITALSQYFRDCSWNSETAYEKGTQTKRVLEQARQDIKKSLKCHSGELVFTSGGTEGNNMAAWLLSKNVCASKRNSDQKTSEVEASKPCIWYSQTAHPSQVKPVLALEGDGWDLVALPVGPSGSIDLDALQTLPKPDVLAVEWVNSEVGFVQPLEKLIELKAQLGFKLWVDGVQGLGKVPLIDLSSIDVFVFSGHKLGSPVGVGGVSLQGGLKKFPWSLGGGQEDDWRSGTVAVPLILSMRDQILEAQGCLDFSQEAVFEASECRRFRVGDSKYSPYVHMLDTSPVDGEILVHQMAAEGVVMGLGSACRSSRKKASATHTLMGLTPEKSRQTLRLSLSRHTTAEELQRALDLLQKLWESSRRFYR